MLLYLLFNFIIFLIFTLEYIIGFPLLLILDLLFFGKRELTKGFIKYLYIEYIEDPIKNIFKEIKK